MRSKSFGTVTTILLFMLAGCGQNEAQPSEHAADTPEIAMARRALLDARRLHYDDAHIERGMNVVIGTSACVSAETCFSCYQCHGIRGAGSDAAGFPRLTGQSYEYLLKSLADFASGKRPNPTMQTVANGLSEQQMRDVAAYYASMTEDPTVVALERAAPVSAQPEVVSAGEWIVDEGSTDGRILACAHCHGPAGIGRPPAYPYLAGQYAGYLERQLKLFRAGERAGTELKIMEELARRMSDEQILAVSQYFDSLQPPTGKVPGESPLPMRTASSEPLHSR
jgi:cytochrome c553